MICCQKAICKGNDFQGIFKGTMGSGAHKKRDEPKFIPFMYIYFNIISQLIELIFFFVIVHQAHCFYKIGQNAR